MINVNSPEILWLVLTILLTAVLWMPQIVHSIFVAGSKTAFLYPDEAAKYYADWAKRSKSAHNNAVENLIIYVPLVLIVLLLEISSNLTAIASVTYFVARAVHYAMHVLAVPLMRTVAFLVGFTCQVIIGVTILNAL